MIFKKQAEEDFNIQAAEFPEMDGTYNNTKKVV
nr:MAG TPA: hypothetical protein [Caudoviricetes sp.]